MARLEGDDQRLRPIEARREARGAWDTAQSAIGPRLAEIHDDIMNLAAE